MARRGRRVYNGHGQQCAVDFDRTDAELALQLQRGFKPIKDKI